MSAWITDRLPTVDDADANGWVYQTGTKGEVSFQVYRHITLGTPWQPITYPEPYVKPKVWTWERSSLDGKDVVIGRAKAHNNIGGEKFQWPFKLLNKTDAQADELCDLLERQEG